MNEDYNAAGDLIVGVDNYFRYLTIRKIEDGTEQWKFSLQGIQEEIRKIRDDIGEDDSYESVLICQFEGDVQEGHLLVQAGPSSFFRIEYPSGEVTYLCERDRDRKDGLYLLGQTSRRTLFYMA